MTLNAIETTAIHVNRSSLASTLKSRPSTPESRPSHQLGRDYKRVHEDVETLESAGLTDRHDHELRTDYDEIRAVIAL